MLKHRYGHEIEEVADGADDHGPEHPARLLEELADKPGGPFGRCDVGLQGADPLLEIPELLGMFPAGKLLNDVGDPPDLGNEIVHGLAVGKEIHLIGLLQEADRLIQGGVLPFQFLRLCREFCDALQEELGVYRESAFRAVGHGLFNPSL